jgi:hypothetical protein
MNTALGLGTGDALDPVDAAFVAEETKDLVSGDLESD